MKCHICNYWTPEAGCKHYLPDSATILKLAGYELTITNGKVVCKKEKEKHKFESVEKAARVLIHDKK